MRTLSSQPAMLSNKLYINHMFIHHHFNIKVTKERQNLVAVAIKKVMHVEGPIKRVTALHFLLYTDQLSS